MIHDHHDFQLPGVNEEWWKYLYSSIVLAFCMLVVIVGSSMFAKTSLFIFLVRFSVWICIIIIYSWLILVIRFVTDLTQKYVGWKKPVEGEVLVGSNLSEAK